MNISKKREILTMGPKILTIGGGTGISSLLRGLKKCTNEITAVVTVADDGGSSGDLRKDLGILPPGDIRACLLALSNRDLIVRELFDHRFSAGVLKNHNMGNLILAALTEMSGSFEEAIEEVSKILEITGEVLPVTLQNLQINAVLENGNIVKGESHISKKVIEDKCCIDRVYIEPERASTTEKVKKAILEADLIVLGPGSLYTSIIPNLLIDDVVDLIYESKAPRVYINNVVTEEGETEGYGVKEHVEVLLKHSKKGLLDYVIINSDVRNNEEVLKSSTPVMYGEKDIEYLKANNIIPILGETSKFLNGKLSHDPERLTEILIDIILKTKERLA